MSGSEIRMRLEENKRLLEMLSKIGKEAARETPEDRETRGEATRRALGVDEGLIRKTW